MKKNQESISSLEQRRKQQKERFGKNDLNVAFIPSVLYTNLLESNYAFETYSNHKEFKHIELPNNILGKYYC